MHNPAYTGVFAFDNDFPALLSDVQPEAQPNASPLLVAEPERGRCRVICFHPNHSLTLARMEVDVYKRQVLVAVTVALATAAPLGSVMVP